MDGSILIIDGQQVAALLETRETRIIELVREAYVTHGQGLSTLPHSSFVTFPNRKRERIIALPGYLGGNFDVAGLKWISSFPENVTQGMDRASALIVLNSMTTGRPSVVMEGASISSKRTAASAALAATQLVSRTHGPVDGVSLIGCGPINFEIAVFLMAAFPELERFLLYDIVPQSAARQRDALLARFPGVNIELATHPEQALAGATIVSLATTAVEPHIQSLDVCMPGAIVLHVSLRDLSPECVLLCDNVVDDFDHVFRANTSLHLAEQLRGSRGFARATLSDVLTDTAPPRADETAPTVFSPFGLGVLDLAVAQYVTERACAAGLGTRIPFFPQKQPESRNLPAETSL